MCLIERQCQKGIKRRLRNPGEQRSEVKGQRSDLAQCQKGSDPSASRAPASAEASAWQAEVRSQWSEVRFVAVSKRFQMVGFRGLTIGMLECCELVPLDRFCGSEVRVCPWVIDTSLPSITPLVFTS